MSIWELVFIILAVDVSLWVTHMLTSWVTNLSSGEFDEEE